jgi:hypothetical protein
MEKRATICGQTHRISFAIVFFDPFEMAPIFGACWRKVKLSQCNVGLCYHFLIFGRGETGDFLEIAIEGRFRFKP